jgi:methionyl-tRNA formyltransferase
MPAMAPLIFFGTPELAIPTLAALVEAGRAPLRVVTQPARPVDRGQQPRETPVARWARSHGLEVLQPARVRSPEFLAELRPLLPAVAVVVAFGQIFPVELLDLPSHGCLNLHASLLPRYRGAAPIQAAIAAGETRTGVTIMRMEQGLDTGPILLQEETPIGPLETAGELAPRLGAIGARLMLEALSRLERGELAARPQDDTLANYAPRLTRASGRVDWSVPAAELADKLRAFTPWPGLTAELRGAPIKLLRATPLTAAPPAPVGTGALDLAGPAEAGVLDLAAPLGTGRSDLAAPVGTGGLDQAPPGGARRIDQAPPAGAGRSDLAPAEAGQSDLAAPVGTGGLDQAPPVGTGVFLGVTPAGLAVACGGGTVLALAEVQRPSRRAQRGVDFANGERLRPGERFT